MIAEAAGLLAQQTVAASASVLALPGVTSRRYANALFKTQLAADLARERATMGCHWHSFHPLSERVHMLKLLLPGTARRRAGVALLASFIVLGCYTVRTAQSQVATNGSESKLIAINMKVFLNGADLLTQLGGSAAAAGWDVLTSDDGKFMLADHERGVDCTARLPAPGRLSATGASFDGMIFLSCALSYSQQVFATPTLIVRDGEPSSIEVADAELGANYRLQFTATTTDAGIAAARVAIAAAKANAAAGTFKLQRTER
jgi:hypothetical protein